jgi:hypothetical protein
MPKCAPSLTDRLVKLAKDARALAEATPPGTKRQALLRSSLLSENALHIQQWLSSPGLRAPN